MKITLTARVGSTILDKSINGWWGSYEVSVFYDAVRYKKTVYFEGIMNNDDIPVQGDGIAVEFCTITKTIEIL